MMDHPFIATLYEVFEDAQAFYLVMELVENGSLLDYINARQVEQTEIRRLFYQLVCVLDHLHREAHVIHRDIKAENILLDRNLNIRIVDFGLSKSFTQSRPYLDSQCGSPAYIAPEVLKKEAYTVAADIWSAGVVLHAMANAKLPFYDENFSVMVNDILTAEPTFCESVPESLRSLIRLCLAKDPAQRIKIEAIQEHPFMIDLQDPRLLAEDRKFLRSLKVFDTDKLDNDVIAQMVSLGYDSANLLNDLATDTLDSRTGAYKILKRAKMINEINAWQVASVQRAASLRCEPRIALAERAPMASSQDSQIPIKFLFGMRRPEVLHPIARGLMGQALPRMRRRSPIPVVPIKLPFVKG